MVDKFYLEWTDSGREKAGPEKHTSVQNSYYILPPTIFTGSLFYWHTASGKTKAETLSRMRYTHLIPVDEDS